MIAFTLLSLMRKGAIGESAQEKILDTLLRHSPDGIVRDDALPFITEILKKGSG